MGTRVGRSYADLATSISLMIAGLLKAKDDTIQAEFAKQLTALLESMTRTDEEQEKAKAALYALTEKLSADQKSARKILAKSISYLEAMHGKTGAALQGYGITRRQPSGKKSSKKSPDKPK